MTLASLVVGREGGGGQAGGGWGHCAFVIVQGVVID